MPRDTKIELGSLGGLNFVKLWEQKHPPTAGDALALRNKGGSDVRRSPPTKVDKFAPKIKLNDWANHKTISKTITQSPVKYAEMRSPTGRFGKVGGHSPGEPEGPDVRYNTYKDIWNTNNQSNLHAISFKSKEPRVWQPRQSGVEYALQVSGLDYDVDEKKGGRPFGIHASFERRLNDTSIKYQNVRSPVGRFSGGSKTMNAWKETVSALNYDVDYGKYKTTTAMVEQSARSYPGVRNDRQSFNIKFSGKSAQFS
jgi:hypothetical protein